MRPQHGEKDRLSTLRRKVVRPWAIVPLVVVVGGGTWWLSRSSSDGEDTATSIERTVEVTSGALDQTVSASGTIEAATVDELSFTSSGRVSWVNIQAGAEVRAGDVLATIDSAELEAAVTRAEATVAEAEATLDDEDAGASDAQIAADESSLDSARRQLEAAQEALDGAQLVATIDGTVSAVNITVGDQLGSGGTSGTAMTGSGSGSGQSAGSLGSGNATVPGGQSGDTSSETTPHIEVVSTGSYLVTLDIDDNQIDLIEEGQEATVTLSSAASGFGGFGGFPGGRGFPGGGGGTGGGDDDQSTGDDQGGGADVSTDEATEATGTVTSVGAIADASSGVARYPVEVTFQGAPDEFHVGAGADVEIIYEEVADAIQAPVQAVTTVDDQSTVVVVGADGDRETRTVETGITSGGMVQITSGLQAGEQVLITMTIGRAGGTDGEQPTNGGGGQFTPPEGFEPPAGFGGGFPGGGGG